MIRLLSVVTAIAIGATIAHAQGAANPIIAQRQDLMKKQDQALYRTGGPMIKGEKPFDLGVAKNIFKTIQETTAKLPALWPEDSQTGETRALPAIWKNKTDFMDWIKQLASDAKEAEATVKDLDSLKVAYDTLNTSCLGCHKDYRAKKQN